MKNDHYFGIFNLAGPDLQVFRQVKECLTLAWDERMKVPHVIAYFFFFVIKVGQQDCSNL